MTQKIMKNLNYPVPTGFEKTPNKTNAEKINK
jgi:hypothetical protein